MGIMIAQDYKMQFSWAKAASYSELPYLPVCLESVNLWVATSGMMLANVERGGEES